LYYNTLSLSHTIIIGALEVSDWYHPDHTQPHVENVEAANADLIMMQVDMIPSDSTCC
jgi:hypothetical protein